MRDAYLFFMFWMRGEGVLTATFIDILDKNNIYRTFPRLAMQLPELKPKRHLFHYKHLKRL